jgi:WD40 repeat protein
MWQREFNFNNVPRTLSKKYCASKRAVHTLQLHEKFHGHSGCVNSLEFNKSGDLLLSGSDDRTVKIWNSTSGECLETLHGHISNVFTASFIPLKACREIVSGSNDSDIRYYDLEKKVCRVYQHHNKKILKISVNPNMPDCFLSCSADGTVRLFDVRQKYSKTHSHTFDEYADPEDIPFIIPQAYGGGRETPLNAEECSDSLVLDYDKDDKVNRMPIHSSAVLFDIDFHPEDGFSFVVGEAFGNARLFDLRKISNCNPSESFVNVYRNINSKFGNYEVTGCVFSNDGSEVVATYHNDSIYVFDKDVTFGCNYFADTQQVSEGNTYKHKYTGHRNSYTIKGVNFYGPNSEYVMTGSDDANVYIWDKETSELLNILGGHAQVVNCTAGHPSTPLLATSGLDHEVVIYQNNGDYPNDEILEEKKKEFRYTTENNFHPPRRVIECLQQ